MLRKDKKSKDKRIKGMAWDGGVGDNNGERDLPTSRTACGVDDDDDDEKINYINWLTMLRTYINVIIIV